MLPNAPLSLDLDAEDLASVDAVFEACEKVDSPMRWRISSTVVEPHGMMGDWLNLAPCVISELKQFDFVVYRQTNDEKLRLAYAGVVSVTGAWVCLAQNHPDDFIVLYRGEIAELYKAISIEKA